MQENIKPNNKNINITHNTSQAEPGALAHCLQWHTAYKIQKFFDLSTPSMRIGRSRRRKKTGKTGEKNGGEKKKRQMKIVATTSLPAVDRSNADHWNAARSRQY